MQVKSVQSHYFSPEELHLLSCTGNAIGNDVWMQHWTQAEHPFPSIKSVVDIQDFMRIKYIDRKWFNHGKMNIIRQQAITSMPRDVSMQEEKKPTPQKSSWSFSTAKLPSPAETVAGTEVYSWFGFKTGKQNTLPTPTDTPHISPSIPKLKVNPHAPVPVVKCAKPLSIQTSQVQEAYGSGTGGTSPTEYASEYSLAAWSAYLSRPKGYSTLESRHANAYKGDASR